MKLARVAVVLTLVSACGAHRDISFQRAIAEGERAQTAGRYQEAAQRYDEAARTSKLPRDREHAAYLAAIAMARTDDIREATTRLDTIARAQPATAHSAEAAYRAADLRLKHGDETQAWREITDVVTRFPNSGVARPAFRRVLAHKDETEGKARTSDYLRDLSTKLDTTDLAESIAYQRALRQADSGDTAGARDALLAMTKRWPYPFGSLWDNGLYRASELDEKLGLYENAVADLETMLREREDSTSIGSYQRPLYGAALMRIAELCLARLHDRSRARDAYHRLYRDLPTSLLRDDALWREAELWRADQENGTACNRLATLASEFPDSRYVPCALVRCPKIVRAEKSRAPKTCHTYLSEVSPRAEVP